MIVEFRLAEHSLRHRPIIEVWHAGRFIASIYGDEDERGRTRITVITKHHVETREERDTLTASSITTIEEP